MELIALLFALSPIIATLIVWACKSRGHASQKNIAVAHHTHEVAAAPAVVAPPIAVAAAASASNDDEITVVLAAAANMYVKSIN